MQKEDSGMASGADTSSALANQDGGDVGETVAGEGLDVDLEKGKVKAAYVEGGRLRWVVEK